MITFETITDQSPQAFWEEHIRPGRMFESTSATGICRDVLDWDYWESAELDELGEQGWMDICVPALYEIGVPKE